MAKRKASGEVRRETGPRADLHRSSATRLSSYWEIAAFGAVIVLAGTVRIIHVAATGDVPFVQHLVGDAAGYYEWGVRIAAGDWVGSEPFYQAPLYPYVLGVLFRWVDESVGTVRVGQALWGALAVGCMAYGTKRLFGTAAGLLAGVMMALYAPAIFFDGVVQKASLGGLLVCGLFMVMVIAQERRGPWVFGVVGIVAGLLVLTRENAAVWLAILAVWVWVSRGCKRFSVRLGAVAWFVAGMGFILLPVGLRNREVAGEWSFSTFQAGPNFYIGNHLGADGRYMPLVRGHETPTFERRDATLLAERAMGRELSAREVSTYWTRRTLADIRAEPMAWLRLMGTKMLMVGNEYEVADAESQYFYAEHSGVLRILGGMWHFGVLCPLAAIGLIETWGRRRKIWVYHIMIVSMAFAVAGFFVLARYRFVIALLLIPFAAMGCVGVWRLVRAGQYRGVLGRVSIAATVALIVNLPVHDEARLDAMGQMNAGVAMAEAGDLPAATKYFRRAVAGHCESAEARNNLAQALAVQGEYAEAVGHYEAVLAMDPGLLGVEYNLAVALERIGRAADALRHYERAVELNPSDGDARAAIARLGE